MLGTAKNDPVLSALGEKFTVAGWTVDVRALEITNGENSSKLEPKVMDLLLCLANRPGEVMTRDELEEMVWRDVVVSYDSLTTAVIKLRKAFGDTSKQPRIIKTVPKVGYSLIAEVRPGLSNSERVTGSAPPGSVEPAANARARWRLSVVAAAIVLLVAVGGVLWWQPWATDVAPARLEAMAFPLPGKPSIAVLAFKNLSENPEQELLSDAMAENIITELSRFSELFVIARNSSFTYKGKPVRVQQVAEELGVRYVIEGSLQKTENQLRVSVQLIDALAGTHLWAERYDRAIEDIFELQDEITSTVVATVAGKVRLKERDRAARKHPTNLAAYEYFLRGEKQWFQWTEEANEQARPSFEKAIELEPELARGHAGLAKVYLNFYRWGYGDMPREEALERALKAARTARELGPFDYYTHNVLAYIHMRSGSLVDAESGFATALEINPNAEIVLVNIAEMRNYQGRFEEAIDLMKKAMRRNPHHPDWYYWNLADAQSLAGRAEEALISINRMSSIRGKQPARRTLALIYVQLGRLDEARAVMAEYLEDNPDFTLTWYRQYLQTLPIQDPAIIDGTVDGMRQAGVPE
jgi:TolB-like protein/DNA-binding winged helix-turn-helix (wHTH) protein/Flp pilus assembly protein TadD